MDLLAIEVVCEYFQFLVIFNTRTSLNAILTSLNAILSIYVEVSG